MMPMHKEIRRLRRCPCCQTKYSDKSARKLNIGKSAARQKQKRDLQKEL